MHNPAYQSRSPLVRQLAAHNDNHSPQTPSSPVLKDKRPLPLVPPVASKPPHLSKRPLPSINPPAVPSPNTRPPSSPTSPAETPPAVAVKPARPLPTVSSTSPAPARSRAPRQFAPSSSQSIGGPPASGNVDFLANAAEQLTIQPSIVVQHDNEPPSISLPDTPSRAVDVQQVETPTFQQRRHKFSDLSSHVPSIAPRKPTNSYTAFPLNCPACGLPILEGKTLTAMNARWHPTCFKCTHCEKALEHLEFFAHEGKPYCHVDYHELFSVRCFHCKTPIMDESFVTLSDEVLGKRSYHELHFFCSNCGDPFIDPKSHQEAKPYLLHKGYPYCEDCDTKMHKTKCYGCKKPIVGDVVKAMQKSWCEACFVCETCRQPFETPTFFIRGQKVYCEHDYQVLLKSEL